MILGSLSARRAWIEMSQSFLPDLSMAVALRKESVDRNSGLMSVVRFASTSLSARRAWIEMVYLALIRYLVNTVALRKESVDRNVYCDTDSVKYLGKSLSARRAWIEIAQLVPSMYRVPAVALRKESVDRNAFLR